MDIFFSLAFHFISLDLIRIYFGIGSELLFLFLTRTLSIWLVALISVLKMREIDFVSI